MGDAWVAAAARVMERADRLATVSEEEGATTRTFLSPAMGEANAVVAEWMRGAGMSTRVDGAGNLRGRIEGKGDAVVLTGSHLDTVRNAGRFDGILGVLLPIAAVEVLREEGWEPEFSLETFGFADEEGVRFQAGCLGSKAVAGRLTDDDLDLRDRGGVTLREALMESGGGKYLAPTWPAGRVRGYVEVHIEQGPELEAADVPVGVVTGINAQNRIAVRVTGRAGHAGTTPMGLRLDAGAGAAEFAVEVERFARGAEGLVATIGTMGFAPGAGNVIPGEAELTLDVRHAVDAELAAACVALRGTLERICGERGLGFHWQVVDAMPAVEFDDELTGELESAVREAGCPVLSQRSGAGHDAMVMAERCPVAMLFVRCRGGLSHHPDESVSAADVAVALRVYGSFLRNL